MSCEIVVEISPSGASHMTAVLRPFHLAKTSGDFTAEVLDVFRWIIIVGYFCLYKAWTHVSCTCFALHEPGLACLRGLCARRSVRTPLRLEPGTRKPCEAPFRTHFSFHSIFPIGRTLLGTCFLSVEVVSLSGLLDAAIVALFIALQWPSRLVKAGDQR